MCIKLCSCENNDKDESDAYINYDYECKCADLFLRIESGGDFCIILERSTNAVILSLYGVNALDLKAKL